MSLSTRASQVQTLLAQDSIKLNEYGTSQLDLPVRFQLVQSAAQLKQSELEVCLKLVEHTSGDDYKASSIGWKAKNKLEEMGDIEMMYLLVRQADGDSQRAGITEDDQQATTEEHKSGDSSGEEGMVLECTSRGNGAFRSG
jgi:hypothetical protein